MKKNAFTLVELLAVIFILGILVCIIYPVIKSVFNDSRKSIYFTSSEELVNKMTEYYVRKKINGSFDGCTYDFNSNSCDCEGFSFDGKKPDSGIIVLDSKGNINGEIGFGNFLFEIINGQVNGV